MKTIVTHYGPDLDAITSIWILKTFFPEWEEAVIAFVPAGETYKDQPVDSDPEILHVDTGFGKFDHHQTGEDICAAILVYQYLRKVKKPDTALERMVNCVNDDDHFREVFYPNPTADYWHMNLVSAIDGWRLIYPDDAAKIVQLAMNVLDGIYKTFQNIIWAEKEITEKGIIFNSRWGKSLGVETTNDEVVHLGQKMGYKIVVRKDPNKAYLRIKAIPEPGINLAEIFKVFKKSDPQATWFLHASGHMILNGSSKNPDMKPTNLSLSEIIDILKKR